MMKFAKFVFLVIVFMFGTVNVFAGLAGPTILASLDTITSDCESVTVSYTVSSEANENLILSVTGFDGDFDVSGAIGSHTVTIPIMGQDRKSSIVVFLRSSISISSRLIYLPKDIRTIHCIEKGDDGRIEGFWADHVIFPLNEGIFVYTDEGELALVIPVESIEMIGIPSDAPRLLGETADGYVRVYRLSNGRYQAMIGPDGEGKTHIVFWEGLGFVYSIESTTQINR